MAEALLVCFLWFVAIAFVALVGHGIWITAAWLIRALFGVSTKREDRRRCPFCQRLTPRRRDRCDWCGRDLRSPLAAELADLEGLNRQLKRLEEAAILGADEVSQLLAKTQQYRRRVLAPSLPAAPTPHMPAAPWISSAYISSGETQSHSPVAARPEKPVRTPGEGREDEEEIVTAELIDKPATPEPLVSPTRLTRPPEPEPTRPAVTATEPTTGPPVATTLQAPPAAPTPQLPLPSKPAPFRPPKPPRKSWMELLAGFLEERNIRWAEAVGVLVGGLLMVGASVALVISLWERLADVPAFKFAVFVTYTSAVFGAGLFAHYRWRLQSTGRGLLVIATLLVPLNFLAMASLSQDDWTLLNVAWEAVSLAIFVYLVGLAAAVLVPGARWSQVGAVVGNSAAVLLLARLAGIESDGRVFLAAGGLPVAVFAASVGGFLYRLSDREDLDPGRAGELFSLLGTAAFTLAVALGLLVARGVKADGLTVTLDRSSILVALAAIPVLAAGLTVARGMSRDAALGAYRAGGTMIALVGVIAMLAALGMAWPQPFAVMAVGGLTAAALLFVAFRYRLPVAHAGVIAAAAVVYLTGYHVLAGNLALFPQEDASRRMLQSAASAESGAALVGLFVLLGMAAELLGRWGDRRHAQQYIGGSAAVALVSLLVVTFHALAGEGVDAPLAMAVYGIYGIGSLILNARFREPLLTYFGLGLLVGATAWGLWWQTETVQPIWATILLLEALVMGLAAAWLQGRSDQGAGAAWNAPRPASDRLFTKKRIDAYRVPLLHTAEVIAPVGLALGAWTALQDLGAVRATPTPVVTAIYAAAFYLLMAWDYRSPERTWVGSMVALAGLVHTVAFNYTGRLQQPWLDALLCHATLAVLASVLLEIWTRRAASRQFVDELRRVFITPLGQTALLSSALAIPVLAMVSWQETISLAACLFWLAGVWMVIAWTNRWPAMVAASQTVLTFAVVVATTAWLEQQAWVFSIPRDLFDPRSLQAYGVAIGLLSLIWVGVRIVLRDGKVAGELLKPHGFAVDRLVRHAVVWLQLLLVGWYLLPGFGQELLPRFAAPTSAQAAAAGPGAWMVLGVMALVVIAALWYRWRISMTSSLLLGATVPCLIAGHGAVVGQQAAASTLRWGLAACFLVCSLAIWGRKRLFDASERARAKVDVGPTGPRLARATLLATTVLPVLVLTLAAAALQMAGVSPGGPAWGTFFGAVGPEVSYLVPLVVVVACLVGFALREASAEYAFSAGLVAKMSVVLGYLVSVATAGETIGATDLVTVLQLLAMTAAVWAIAWMVGRRWADVWTEDLKPGSARILMNVQLGIGALAFGLVWLPAVLALALYPPRWHAWTIAAGSPLGWLALAAMAAAVIYRQVQRGRPLRPGVAGLVGMVAIGLLACTIRGLPQFLTGLPQLAPEWGYRTLMLGWGMYALLVVLVTWWVATVRTLPDAKGPPQALIRAAAGWVSAAGLLAVLLGLKAAALHRLPEDLLWAAAAIGLASAASAAMSVWRRQEGWAFAAAPGVNLAASLVVWYYQHELAFHEWWILLVEANVIASASVALVWLAARKRLYELRELSIGTSPLLAAQTSLGIVGTALLLAIPVVRLVAMPAHSPGWTAPMAEPAGWISLLVAALAAAWYLRQVAPEQLFHVVGGLALGIGVLVACYTAGLSEQPPPDWLAYHVLTTCWAAGALVVLAVGLLGRNLRLAGQTDPGCHRPSLVGQIAFPPGLVGNWVTVIGAGALALALGYCLEDPGRPWWSAQAILAASVTAGLLAMWLRLPSYVYLSGLLINVAGTVMWMAWDSPWTISGLVHTNVLCLAAASCAWSLVRHAHPDGVPAPFLSSLLSRKPGGRPLPFAHLAVQAGLAILAVLVVILVTQNVSGDDPLPWLRHSASDWLGWLALAVVVLATTISLWDRSARFSLQALYVAGLVAVGMALNARELSPRIVCWTAGHELAGFVLLAAALGWLLARMRPIWQAIRIPDAPGRLLGNWLPEGQALVAGLAAVLGVWISMDFAFDGITRPGVDWISGRMAGPLATAGLILAAILTANRSRGRWRIGWQGATFALAGLALAELAWAWLDPAWLEQTGASAWLHRNVILMVAAVAMTLVAEFALALILPAGSDWIASGRRMTPGLAGLAAVLLAAVIGHEALLFEFPDGTPTALWAIVVVAGALMALTVGSLSLALLPSLDPLRMSERGRTAYVYAAEALGGLVGVHLSLTMPWLFRLGIVEHYWMLLVMVVAGAGVGLSELFQRRGTRVLSQPLERTAVLLPLAPAIVFWLPVTPQASGFAGKSPAFWFLGTLFYGFLAVSKRSSLFSLVALVTGNVGLCLLWQQGELGFWEYPQLWLIPIGLSALVAEYVNYDRLTKAQSAVLRYVALSLIYVPSSTEFLDHLGESLWLPLVLILLSVLGVLAGVVLRVRSFVALGVTFLALVIVSMICHAAFAEKHIWIFWVFCISLGAAIMTLIAVFEKRRPEILAGVARFREWERRPLVLKSE